MGQIQVMKRDIQRILRQYFLNKPVHRAYLFGSMARDEDDSDSDIDILVELDYKGGANYFLFIDMQNDLTSLLHNKVDLVSANGLSPYMKPIIDRGKKLIYERKPEG